MTGEICGEKIIILSNTHDLLRPEAEARLAEADIIAHAGDLCWLGMADALRAYAETYIVRGNNDGSWARGFRAAPPLRWRACAFSWSTTWMICPPASPAWTWW